MKMNIRKRLTFLTLALLLVVGLVPALALTADAGGTSSTGSVYVADAWMFYNMSIDTLTITSYGETENHDGDCGALLYSVTKLSPNNYRVSYRIMYSDNGKTRESSTFSMDLQLSGDCRNGRSVSIGPKTENVKNTSYTFTATFSHSARSNHGGGEATCVSDAFCAVCGMKYADRKPDDHQWSWVTDDTTHSRTCSRTGCGKTESGDHTTEGGSAATCANAAVCGICQKSYGKALEHNYSYSISGDSTIIETCDKGCGHSASVALVRDEGVSTAYTGSQITPYIAQETGTTVAEYTVSYENNVVPGTATVTLTMADTTITRNFEITRGSFGSNVVKGYTGTYDGQPHGIVTGSLPAGSTVYYKDSAAGEYSATPVKRTDAGTTKVWYKLTNPNYVDKEGTATIKINPASISTAIASLSPAASRTYSGQALIPGVSVSFASVGRLTEGTDYEVSWDKEGFVKPDMYWLTITGKNNFEGTKTEVYTIRKADLKDVSVAQKNALTYTGTPQTAEVTTAATTVDGAEVTFTYSTVEDGTYGSMPAFTEAGEYTVYYKASAPNHNDDEGSFTVTVGKANPTVTAPVAKSGLVYDGTAKELVNAGESEHGTFQYRLSESDAWGDTIPTGTNGGNYTVYWKLTGDKNHNDKTGSVSATIGRSPVTLTAADFTFTAPENLTYSGTPKTAKIQVKDKDGVGTITVKYDKNPVNAGDYKVSIDVAAGTNYEAATGLTSDDWTFTITKAQPEIRWDTTEFTYNGEEQGEASVILVGGESYSGTVKYFFGIGSDATGGLQGLPVNAGTYVIQASIDAQENYSAARNQTTIVIKAKEVTPTATLATDVYTYDAQAKTPAVTVFDGETEIPAAEYTVSYANNTAVGAATVTITDKDGGNYSFTAFSKVFVILPDASALDGVTTENVNAGDQAAIDEIQAAMEGKDITGASVTATGKWRSLVDFCARLERKISDAETGAEAITAGTAALTAPKTSDLETIRDLLNKYEQIEDNLTAAQKTALEDEVRKLEELNEEITDANAGLKEITDGVAELEEDPRVFADKATVKALLKKTKDLKDNTYLTDAEKTALAGAESKLKAMEAEFTAAEKVEADYLNKLPAANIGTKKSVDTYEAAKTAYEALGADKAKVDPKAVKKLTDFKNTLTDYKITKGSGTKWAKNGTTDLTFTANGYYPHFKGVKIDGKTIDAANYTAKAGSTIVTLKKEYLKTLKNGDHVVAITFGDGDYEGEATGIFRVIPSATTPATGDSILIPFMLMVLSMTGLAAMFVLKKRSC